MRKTIFLCTLILMITFAGSAQNANTKYDNCNLLSQYAGEWKYTQGTTTIRIFLRVHQDYSASLNRVSDCLYGWVEYTVGGTVIESTYQYKDISLPYLYDAPNGLDPSQWSATLSLKTCTDSYPELTGTIFDHLQSNEIQMVTATPDANKTLLLWKQKRREGFGTGTGATGMTLPAEFLLVKQ